MNRLYTIVRFYGIDPRVLFYHERELDDPARSEFHALVATCSEEEAIKPASIARAILEVLREKRHGQSRESYIASKKAAASRVWGAAASSNAFVAAYDRLQLGHINAG